MHSLFQNDKFFDLGLILKLIGLRKKFTNVLFFVKDAGLSLHNSAASGTV